MGVFTKADECPSFPFIYCFKSQAQTNYFRWLSLCCMYICAIKEECNSCLQHRGECNYTPLEEKRIILHTRTHTRMHTHTQRHSCLQPWHLLPPSKGTIKSFTNKNFPEGYINVCVFRRYQTKERRLHNLTDKHFSCWRLRSNQTNGLCDSTSCWLPVGLHQAPLII